MVRRQRQRQQMVGLLLLMALVLVLVCGGTGLAIGLLLRRAPASTEPGGTEAGPVRLEVLYSPEKEAWFQARVEEFNQRGERVGGRTVQVVAEALDSGEALEAIVSGERAPAVWSPASTLWVPLLNRRWQEQSGSSEPLAVYPEPLMVSPLVIAVWQDRAQALGYPGRELGWQDIISATLDPRGWGAYGHPEWGRFTLGHTNPYFSNSGLLSVAAESYAAAGKVRDLTAQDLAQPRVRAYVQQIEQSIIHYGESSEYFAQQMAQRGPAYASAVILEENTIIRLNQGVYGPLPQPLVAIYPREGTFWSDHPYVILRGDWVDADQHAAALLFRDFLLSGKPQQQALQEGFRPADVSIPLANSIIGPAVGVDPFKPETVLEVPSADTLDALLQAWQAVRKRVNVLLVVDISGSMEGEKLAAVQAGLKTFLDELADDDQVGILVFNDQITSLSPLTPLGPKRQEVERAIDDLVADYKTVLHDVTLEAVRLMTVAYDAERINAVVLMTDGLDTASRVENPDAVIASLETSARSERPVRVFTIAYGEDADRALLERIAQATGGRMVEGTPENIRRIYFILSSYF